jgi:zinc and cadmium transporter
MHEIWLYSLASVFIVSFVSFAGIFTLMIKEGMLKKILLFLVSFSAGALIGDSFIHLLPQVVETSGFTLEIAFSLMAGILLFFVLEKFIQWRHCHIPTSAKHPHPLAMMNLVGDGFHNFIDGMIIAGSYLVNVNVGIATTLAVVLHEIPQEISDLGVLLHSGLSKNKALLYNFMSALVSVIGAIFALLIGGISTRFLSLLAPFTIGGFIYIASADLIPELQKETDPKKSALQFLGLLLGIAVMFSLLLFE